MKQVSRLLASLLLVVPLGSFAQVTLTHVHGLAYSADGKRLMIPSHHGLAIYEGGKWSKAPGPQHDYMGFSATTAAIYSSGHPEQGSGLVNPFGLLRSRDGGKTWQKLGLEGESDFHLLGTSWNTSAVYVWNPAPNSRMAQPGLHVTANDGGSWQRAAAAGLDGQLRALAVHPKDPAIVALATSRGLYLSRDSGESFVHLASEGEGTSVFFDLEGKQLWYGFLDGRPHLARLPLDGGHPTRVALPALKKDAVSFVAQNPTRRLEYAMATLQRDVYLSKDAGESWLRIAERGITAARR